MGNLTATPEAVSEGEGKDGSAQEDATTKAPLKANGMANAKRKVKERGKSGHPTDGQRTQKRTQKRPVQVLRCAGIAPGLKTTVAIKVKQLVQREKAKLMRLALDAKHLQEAMLNNFQKTPGYDRGLGEKACGKGRPRTCPPHISARNFQECEDIDAQVVVAKI